MTTTKRSSPCPWRRSSIRSTTSKSQKCVELLYNLWLTHRRVLKTSELARRIKDAEKAVKRLVTEEYVESGDGLSNGNRGHHRGHSSEDTEAQQRRDAVTQDAGSDDDDTEDEDTDLHSMDALEDQFLELEEEVATLVADVHDLALYTKLNITGFMKILKVYLLINSAIGTVH